MILYHGTDAGSARDIDVHGINLLAGEPKTDFGQGFYTTIDFNTAAERALHKAIFEDPCVVCVDFDNKMAETLVFKRFLKPDYQWAQFIINNRNGIIYAEHMKYNKHNLDARYDIVSGQIADGNIMRIARILNREKREVGTEDLKLMLARKFPFQYSFHTEESLACIKDISVQNLGGIKR